MSHSWPKQISVWLKSSLKNTDFVFVSYLYYYRGPPLFVFLNNFLLFLLFLVLIVCNIANLAKGWEKDKSYVYIGRPSKWGNPYKLSEDSRDELIKHYKDYLENSNLKEKLYILANKKLVCFCTPKKCHGNVLVELFIKIGNCNK